MTATITLSPVTPHPPPSRTGRRRLLTAATVTLASLTGCAIGGVLTSALTDPPPHQPTSQICHYTAGTGSYYLLVTTTTGQWGDACAGAVQQLPYPPAELAGLPDVLTLRCQYPQSYTAAHHVQVDAYSTGSAEDLAAVRVVCAANGAPLLSSDGPS